MHFRRDINWGLEMLDGGGDEKQREVRICPSCARRCLRRIGKGEEALAALPAQVKAELVTLTGMNDWQVSLGSCFRFCPDDRVTWVVTSPQQGFENYLSVAPHVSPSEIAESVRRLLASRA